MTFFAGCAPILGMETLSRPFFYRNCDQNLRFLLVCNLNCLQNLAPAKGFLVNDWLTVTNWIPPVNDAWPHLELPKIGNQSGLKGRLPGSGVQGVLVSDGSIVMAPCRIPKNS